MNNVSNMAVLALLLAMPAAVLALGMETFGNAPVAKQNDWPDGVIDMVNLPSRVYANWVNGNENFYYRGDAKALNEALRQFALVKENIHEVILMPGKGKTQSFHGKPIEYDWNFHVVGGIARAVLKQSRPTMTIFISAKKPGALQDTESVKKWLTDLESDIFATRDKATQELIKVGRDAKPFLRAALKDPRTLESRRRILAILDKLPGIDVTDLEIPKGVTITSVADLEAKYWQGLKETDTQACSQAINGLSTLAAYNDKVLPALIDMLKKEKNEYVRRVAASCLASLPMDAKAALPALKEGLTDPDANIRQAFGQAIELIEKSKVNPRQEEGTRGKMAIIRDINEFKTAWAGKE